MLVVAKIDHALEQKNPGLLIGNSLDWEEVDG
jgi:hypothetical protein